MFDEVTSIVEASSEMETEKETGYERGENKKEQKLPVVLSSELVEKNGCRYASFFCVCGWIDNGKDQ
ncbi:hypothetical protein Bca4012_035887 [Brassica carinata]